MTTWLNSPPPANQEYVAWIDPAGNAWNLVDLNSYYAEGPLPPVGEYGVPISIVSHGVPLAPGVVEQWIQIAANDVRFPLRILGPNTNAIEAARRTLSEAMRATRGVGILQHGSSDNVIRQLNCREVTALRDVVSRTPGSLLLGLVFSAADPFWYDANFTSQSFAPTGLVNFFPTVVTPLAPAAPVPTTLATGGTILAGTYQVEIAYFTGGSPQNESGPSMPGSIVTTGSTSTITIPSPSAAGGATGWYAYVTQVGGSTFTRQQAAGSPTAIGTNLTLTAPPTSTGAAPTSFLPVHLSAGGLSTSFPIENNGQAEAWPIWTVTGPGTSPTITNVTTGEILTSSITLSAGQVLTIDTRPGQVSVLREDGSNQWATISDTAQLWPFIVGVNVVQLAMGSTSVASQLQVQYKQRYWGV